MRFQVITEVLKKCLLFGLERRSDWYIGDDVSKERGTLIFRVFDRYWHCYTPKRR